MWVYILMVLGSLLLIILMAMICIPCVYLSASWLFVELKWNNRITNGADVAFFHPFCMAGGEKEKVLWMAVRTLINNSHLTANVHIYTVVTAEPQTILDQVERQFNITLDPDKIKFIRLKWKGCISSRSLFGQGYGSVITSFEAFMRLNPYIYIDTSGYPFTHPIFHIFAQCPVGYFVYPVIHTTPTGITSMPPLKWFKAMYVGIFAWWSDVMSRSANVVMVIGGKTEGTPLNETPTTALGGYGSLDVEAASISSSTNDVDDPPPGPPPLTSRERLIQEIRDNINGVRKIPRGRLFMDHTSDEEFEKTFIKAFHMLDYN